MEYELCVCYFPKIRLHLCFVMCILLEMIAYFFVLITECFDDSGDVLRGIFFFFYCLYVLMFTRIFCVDRCKVLLYAE